MRFLDLIPIEYDRGTDDGRVTLDFEVQEAVAFQQGTESAFADLEGELKRRDPRATAVVDSAIERLGTYVEQAQKGERVASQEEMERAHARAADTLEDLIPEEWELDDSQSDFDLIQLTLDRVEAAAGAGRYAEAEQARLEAYAFFEFGPELTLRSIAPDVTARVEGLIWFGAEGQEGLATLIADKKRRRDIHETRLVLDQALEDGAGALGEGASSATVVTNAAVIVFREGLEAVADPGRGHGQPERRRPHPAAPDDDRRPRWRSSPASSPTCSRAPCSPSSRSTARSSRRSSG